MANCELTNENMTYQFTYRYIIQALFSLLLLAACGSKPTAPADFLPPAGAVANWTPAGEVRLYNRDNLYDMVDGQADSFFVYGFKQVAAQNYQQAAGAVVTVEIWQMATPADAYGLFTSAIAGEPIAIGNDGDSDTGRRLAFWQNRYYVQVYARHKVDDSILTAFAKAAAQILPTGGERPAVVKRLPPNGLAARGFVFFHEEISIQNEIWLGGENILGLNQQTNGVLGRYEVNGAPARLLVIEYPTAKAAADGLAALQKSQAEELAAADASDKWLAAVFGQLDSAAAQNLLTQTLGK
jgi:hypothetical protein